MTLVGHRTEVPDPCMRVILATWADTDIYLGEDRPTVADPGFLKAGARSNPSGLNGCGPEYHKGSTAVKLGGFGI